MRVEEITESGIFKFITKDGSSSDFLGQLEILDGGKGKIILSMVNPTSLPCNLGEQFNLIGNLHTNNNCIFTDCFINWCIFCSESAGDKKIGKCLC
mgnify:CR=1 FL=1